MKKYFFSKFSHTSYVKLQDAFVAENGNAIGNFELIGYVVPGGKSGETEGNTTNFTYKQEGTYPTDNSAVDPAAFVAWSAKNKAKLNDCESGQDANWELQITIADNSDGATWKTKSLSTGCKALTPNFDKIGNGGTYEGS